MTGVGRPLVSVVVPTHGRPRRLERLLAALRQQTIGAASFETIVVVDGADPEALAVVERERARGGMSVTAVPQAPAQGPGAARNAGWRKAVAAQIAFTDDDCVPSPSWLAEALAKAQPGTFVQGRTKPDPSELADNGLLSRTLRSEELGPWFETCNILYPRNALESLGGFDDGFGRTPGGEDTDLAWRAIGAGWKPVFAPQALVFHAVERLGVAGSLRVAGRWTRTVRAIADHPATRSKLYRGCFWNVWHYLMWRSALAMLGPRSLRRFLIARHLMSLRERARGAGSSSWAIPFLIAYDLVECWAVARGALRYRTPVL